MSTSLAIAKVPELAPAQNYTLLREEGLRHIERLGSALWTDYNLHDPGITLLEVLCYAITDLGYRADFPVADLLAEPPKNPPNPARQAFYTAREILTMNPLTLRDFRKQLIDLDGVKNAWLSVVEDYPFPIYADCKASRLRYSPETAHLVVPRGLYDVLVEFEDDAQLGNPNSGKVCQRASYLSGSGERFTALVELRFPNWNTLAANPAAYAAFRAPASRIEGVTVQWISGNQADDEDVHEADRARALKTVLFATLQVDYLADASDPASSGSLTFVDVPMRVWFPSDAARRALTWPELKAALEDGGPSGAVGRYQRTVLEADAILAAATRCLHSVRNLCEDFRDVTPVPIEDVAVCADLDVEPSADIEAVLAEAYDLIDQYLSPDLRFRTLKELLDAGTPVEEIFEGPALDQGFLESAEVDATELRKVVYASDLVNLIADIEGVKAVRNFRMSKYDAEGRQSGPSEPWELRISAGHAPRFYSLATKFLVFKNGLTFLPDQTELGEVLQVIRGKRSRPKLYGVENDLEVPRGVHRELDDYLPVQHQLPKNYGVGPEGLPASAGVARLSLAKQLRAYLLFFEQQLVNYLAQLANVKELFAVDDTVDRSVFSRLIGDELLPGVEAELYRGMDPARLQALLETEPRWLDRRNRFLDHLLGRFAESFADYSVMLFRHAETKAAAQARLIEDKIAFLRDLPVMTHARAKAFDYTRAAACCPPVEPDAVSNAAGLGLRIKRLLGLRPPDDEVLVIEHLLLRPRLLDDPLLNVCLPENCETCGEEDPYSFRLTLVLSGEGGLENGNIDWRRFAENAVRYEVPAHLAVKVCWVSSAQLASLRGVWCAWLSELRKTPADSAALRSALEALLAVFHALKSVYPPASLHDCVDGNDDNRVYLDRSVITSKPRVNDAADRD